MRRLYELGELRLDPDARVLTRAGEPAALGARGVAVLAVLVDRAGEYVPKAAIMDAAWPGLVVEEANLAVQVSAIRRTLAGVGGEGWIETLPRRGYRYVGPRVEVAGRPAEPAVAADRAPDNLPQAQTSFVGREREIAQIKQLLPATRLVTLTGTGGIGKTRLAVQAAAEVADAYRDGVRFVDFAPLADPERVPGALAQLLRVREAAGVPLVRTLCEHLRDKEMLLVLDNCEHVLGAAADLADALLRDTARVGVVATSREPLRVAGERVFPVDALPLPDPKSAASRIARSDAVRLFVDRARQHRPRFDLDDSRARAVAEICVRLDGLPLALELAAARVAVLPVEEIERLLDQRFRLLTRGGRDESPRQRTLRAMIDWSHELLEPAERDLFARLSVFAGGWTLDAAKEVGAGGAIAADDVVYLLIALIEKSLVVADESGDRYRMLETLREYARERLEESGVAAAARDRHLAFFLALAVDMKPKLLSTMQASTLKHLEAEYANMLAALDWSHATPAADAGLRLCGTLQVLWITRGWLAEGRQACMRALARDGASAPTSERATALNATANMAATQSDFDVARTLYGESLAIRRQLGDRSGVATLLNNLGLLEWHLGKLDEARGPLEESLAIMRELDNRMGMANALNNLGNIAQVRGDLDAARTLQEESLALMREVDNGPGTATLLNNLGELALARGDRESAQAMFDESLAVARELGFNEGVARALSSLGTLAEDRGDLAQAQAAHRECLAIRRELGDRAGIADALEDLAVAMATAGRARDAARTLAAAKRLREEIGAPLPPSELPRYDRRVAAVRAVFGDPAAHDRAWEDGRALSLEQAIELAMAASSPGAPVDD